MNIKFTVEPIVDTDEYLEEYTVDILWDNGASYTFQNNSDHVSYDEFRAYILEDLVCALADIQGISVNIEEEDYSFTEEDIDDLLEDYLEGDNNGC